MLKSLRTTEAEQALEDAERTWAKKEKGVCVCSLPMTTLGFHHTV